MEAPDIIDEPEDHDALAAQAADQGRSQEERGRAFSGLRSLIRRLAISLSVRLTGRVVPELTDGADGEVYLRLGGFTPSGSFAAWCHRTLHNWMVDELRKESRRQEHEREAARLRAEAEAEEPLEEGLSQQELEAMGGWHAGQRLALLCLTGLWRDVPEGIWRQWCEAYTPGGEQLLTWPFPPQEFETCPDRQERADILAQLLRVRRGTLAVWVHRCASRLRELRGL
jgi:DNA-directed RNA polymerase specialized sigma24 family protein